MKLHGAIRRRIKTLLGVAGRGASSAEIEVGVTRGADSALRCLGDDAVAAMNNSLLQLGGDLPTTWDDALLDHFHKPRPYVRPSTSSTARNWKTKAFEAWFDKPRRAIMKAKMEAAGILTNAKTVRATAWLEWQTFDDEKKKSFVCHPKCRSC